MGRFTELPLIKNERAVGAMDSPWDDGELASPRRGEAKRIGALHSFRIYSFFSSCEKHIHKLGVVRIDSIFSQLIAAFF